MTTGKRGTQRDPLLPIIGVIMSMSTVFGVLNAILPSGLTQPVATLALGFLLTAALVRGRYWSVQTAGITWLGTSTVLVIAYLIMSQPATVTGQVTKDDGTPIPDLPLVLTNSSGIEQRVLTDKDGRFEVRNVPEGPYTVSANNRKLYASEILPGWKRIFSPTVPTGNIIYAIANVSTSTALPPPTATSTPSGSPTSLMSPIASALLTATLTRISIPAAEPSNTKEAQTAISPKAMLFAEDFETGTARGWFGTEGVWEVVRDSDGNYVLSGKPDFARTFIGTAKWKNYAFELRFKASSDATVCVFFRSFGFSDGYNIGLTKKDGGVSFFKKVHDITTELVGGYLVLRQNPWTSIHVEVVGSHMTATVNGTRLLDTYDSTYPDGGIGLVPIDVGADGAILFDDIRVWSLDGG